MPLERRLKLLYGVCCATWLTYVTVKLLSVTASQSNPNPMAFVYCFALIGVLPAVLGYVMLFKLSPWLGRTLRRRA